MSNHCLSSHHPRLERRPRNAHYSLIYLFDKYSVLGSVMLGRSEPTKRLGALATLHGIFGRTFFVLFVLHHTLV
jgi:hypothetical protein